MVSLWLLLQFSMPTFRDPLPHTQNLNELEILKATCVLKSGLPLDVLFLCKLRKINHSGSTQLLDMWNDKFRMSE